MTTKDTGSRRMKTTEKSLRVLETVNDLDHPTVTTVAEKLDMNKGSVYTHLLTLTEHGYLIRQDDEYQLGMKTLRLGIAARQRDSAYTEAQKITKKLANETNERAQFIIEEYGDGIYLFESMGPRGISTGPQIGGIVPLHATASGKAILANLPKERRDAIISDNTLEAFTRNTIDDPEALIDQLKQIKDRGFAINEQEDMEGINAIGTAVKRPDGDILGSLSIAGPSHRLGKEKLETKIADTLLGYANELELNLGDSSDSGFPYSD